MIFGRDFKMAVTNLRTRRWRSGMTMFGIIVGVSSVVTIVSLGQGLKQQVAGQINSLGADIVTIRPGKIGTQSVIGLQAINPLSLSNVGRLDERDYLSLKKLSSLPAVAPMLYVGSGIEINGKTANDVSVIGTTSEFADIVKREVAFGYFFGPGDSARNIAVIGKDVALANFGAPNPIGEAMNIQGESYIIAGIFAPVASSYLSSIGVDLNTAVVIPYDSAKQLPSGQGTMVQIITRVNYPSNLSASVTEISDDIVANHKGQQDFTVLKQQDILKISDDIVNGMTKFIGGIAAVSLLVGGIGIMNIMLVSVSERTKEIGIRKAIGASNRQILMQYLTEGIVLSITGGIIGAGVALVINGVLRFYTSVRPSLSAMIFVLPLFVSIAIGIVFSVAPALKAARKDPIKALRGE